MAAAAANTGFAANDAAAIQTSTMPSYATPAPAQAMHPAVLTSQGPQGFAPVPGTVHPPAPADYSQQQHLNVQQPSAYLPGQPLAQNQAQSHVASSGATGVAGSGKTSSLQGHLNKVKGQLETKGGKQGAWLAQQLQTQAAPLVNKVAVVGDVHGGGKALGFEVYRGGNNVFSKDDVVKDEMGNAVYYLSFPHNIGSSWNCTLYRGGAPSGQPLATLRKQGSFGNPLQADDIAITLPGMNGFTTTLTKGSLLSSAHDWAGVGGGRYRWKSESKLNSNNMMCLDLANGHVAATWEKSYVTYGKDGKILVNPNYTHEMDLIVATGLAMEEWKREEAEKKGQGGMTSNKNLLGMGMKFLGKK